MKVFKINEFDWVAAASMAEAIEWYERTTGFDWVEDKLVVEECDLDAPMEYTEDFYNEPKVVQSTFRELLEKSEGMYPNQKEPYVILSTEY